MALVLAGVCSEAGHQTRLWPPLGDAGGRLSRTRRSARMPAFELPSGVKVIEDAAEAFGGVDAALVVIPTEFLRATCQRLRGAIGEEALVCSFTKGIEVGSLEFPSRIIGHELRSGRHRDCVSLSGPNIAAEMVRGAPTAMVSACPDVSRAEQARQLLVLPRLKIYTTTDVLGLELVGAAKNVVALAAGMLDGLEAGVNAKSVLLARGLAEIVRLGLALGASMETFFGVAGVGDLATTCFSPEGRNRRCGEAIARGASLSDYCAASPCVIEGVQTTRALAALAARSAVEMPIAAAVHAVLFEGLQPAEALASLMARESRQEQRG